MQKGLTIHSLQARISRIDLGRVIVMLSPVSAIILALLVVGGVVLILGHDPVEVYLYLARGAFGSRVAFATGLNKSVPFIFVALATAIAFRAGVWNIGQEGQLQLGGMVVAWLALDLHLSPVLTIVLCLAAAALAGAIYAIIPGVLKAQWGLNEVITTIMLNYIAILGVLSLVLGPLLAPNAAYAHTEIIPDAMRLPLIWPGTRLHFGFVLALIGAAIVWFLLYRTTTGFEIRGMGFSLRAAKDTGMPIKRIILTTMVLSGAFAGLAGGIQVLGMQFQIAEGWSRHWGFTGISVALLGELKPSRIILAGIFFGMLEGSAASMQALTGVPGQLVLLLQALPVIFLMALQSSTITNWLVRHKEAEDTMI